MRKTEASRLSPGDIVVVEIGRDMLFYGEVQRVSANGGVLLALSPQLIQDCAPAPDRSWSLETWVPYSKIHRLERKAVAGREPGLGAYQ